jgi:electron transfer flavoprotein beta subunit
MNIIVCIKQVPDTEAKIKLNADSSGIDTTGFKWIVSPYDEFAIEEAIRVREKNPGSTVTVFSAGPARVAEAIRTALAMGADNGVQVEVSETADSALVAQALGAAILKEGKPDLVFTGKEAIDDGASQVSQLVAEKIEVPYVTVVAGIEYSGTTLKVRREIEGGAFEVIQIQTPCLIATQKGLNEPRYASLPNIMKAKKKEIKILKLSDLGVSESAQKIRYKNFQLPPPKPPGRKIEGEPAAQAKELVRLLREEAKVI